MKRCEVQVPLHHDRLPGPSNCIARPVEPVKVLSLGVDRALRGVDVLGRLRVSDPDQPPSEADDVSRQTVDRKHQPVAEAIVVARSVLSRGEEPTSSQQPGRMPRRQEIGLQRVPGGRRIPDSEGLDRVRTQSTLLHVGPGRGALLGVAQRLPEEGRRLPMDLEEYLAIRVPPPPGLPGPGGSWQLDPGLLAEDPCSFLELHLLVQHDELESVTAGMTAEAIEELFLLIH